MKLGRKTKIGLLSLGLAVLVFFTFAFGAGVGYRTGLEKGYFKAITDIQDFTGIEFKWTYRDGTYVIEAYFQGSLIARSNATLHLWIEHWRNGELLSQEYGAGVLTNIGKDWIEQQLAASDGTQEALYCADSNNDTDPPLATWTILPQEITTNGLDRQTGTYTSTGVGTWNVTVTKSVTGTQSTQLWGLHWIVTDASDNNLLAADSGPAQKNCVAGDTLKETWQITVS